MLVDTDFVLLLLFPITDHVVAVLAFLTIDSTSKGESSGLEASCTDYITGCKSSWVMIAHRGH